MKIAIPVYDEVDMLDVAGPFEMFDWAGYEVELVATEARQVRFRGRGFPNDNRAGEFDRVRSALSTKVSDLRG